MLDKVYNVTIPKQQHDCQMKANSLRHVNGCDHNSIIKVFIELKLLIYIKEFLKSRDAAAFTSAGIALAMVLLPSRLESLEAPLFHFSIKFH